MQNQSRVVTDGVDHTEGIGGTGFYEDYFANEEVSISALGSDVEMNSPRRRHRGHDQERRQHVQGPRERHLRAGQLRRHQRRSRPTSPSRGYTCPNDGTGQSAVRQPQSDVLRGARRSGRADHEGQDLVLRRLQSLQDRQAGVGRRRRASPPTSASSTTTRASSPASWARTTRSSATTSGPQAEAEARSVDAAAAGVGPRAGQHVAHVQGRVAVRDQRPHVPQRERRQLHARLADGGGGGSGGQAGAGLAAIRRRRAAPAGTRSRRSARSRR